MAHGGSWKTKRIGAGFLRALMYIYIYIYNHIYIYNYIYGITQFIAALIGKVMISHHISRLSPQIFIGPELPTAWNSLTDPGNHCWCRPSWRWSHPSRRNGSDVFIWNTKILWVCIQCSRYIEYQYITLFTIYIYMYYMYSIYIYIYNVVMQFKALY